MTANPSVAAPIKPAHIELIPEPLPPDDRAAIIRYYEMRLRHLKSEVAETERLIEILRSGR